MMMMGSTGPFAIPSTHAPFLLLDIGRKDFPSLKSLAMYTSLKLIQNSQQGSGQCGRDARELKRMRQYLNENLPRSLQQEMVQEIVGLKDVNTVLNLMEVLEPKSLIQDEVNMLGLLLPSYFHKSMTNNESLMECFFARLDPYALDAQQCNRLWRLIQWSNVLKRKLLQTFIILTRVGVDALSSSNLPNVFARSPNLTSVTLLNGATNHILRILGRNCHSLRSLDVSRSTAVTNSGLAGLLLKKWRTTTKNPFTRMSPASVAALSREDKYPCSASLRKLTLVETGVTLEAINLGCILLGGSYYIEFYPDSLITRPLGGREGVTMANNSTIVENEASLMPIFPGDENADTRKNIEYIVKNCVEKVGEEGDIPQILDHYFIPEWGTGQSFVRRENSYRAEAIIGTRLRENKYLITELILPFKISYWDTLGNPDLNLFGTNLKTLKFLKGRIHGVWGQNRELFPNLVEIDVWTVNGATIMSLLEFCPRIQKFKLKCLNAIRPDNPEHYLNDENFARSINNNESLLQNLQEFIITVKRPVRDFTLNSASLLLERAPNLRRIGDVGMWEMTNFEAFVVELRKTKACDVIRYGTLCIQGESAIVPWFAV